MMNKTTLFEGGNAYIDGHRSEKLDLSKINRATITPIIWNLLLQINKGYTKTHGAALWSSPLLKTKEFLSGSSFHFFNDKIPHDTFVQVKPLVGDIDTQVDKESKAELGQFLSAIKGKNIGGATLRGADDKGNQFITIWELDTPPIKIQIDFELVDYHKGSPTEWSKFSHSSSWDDLQAGIKGVFHKYLMRACTTNTLKPRYIRRPKSIKFETSTDIAFSSDYGMREKFVPTGETYDDGVHGEHEVYKEVPTKGSKYVSELPSMFELVFGQKPTKQQVEQFKSFRGTLQIISELLDKPAQEKIFIGFVRTLFGAIGQTLYRDDPARDKSEKLMALAAMIKDLDLRAFYAQQKPLIEKDIKDFYSRYVISEDVKASPRQGIQHMQKMKETDFLNFVSHIRTKLGGKLNNIHMTLKIDGVGARFGMDNNSQAFFESSHSGPIFKHGSFSAHAASRGFDGVKLERAKHYDEIHSILVSTYARLLPPDTKVNCEILYNPMGELSDDGIKFVTVRYPHDKLGQLMSIVPHNIVVASTGEPHPDSNALKDKLIAASTKVVRVIDDRLTVASDLDITAIVKPLDSLPANALDILQSRKKVDAEDKAKLRALIQSCKDALADYILTHSSIQGLDNMGKDIEGLILHRDDNDPIKVTHPDFKSAIAQKQTLSEAAANKATVAFCFGRFNPPHKGHKAVWDAVRQSGTDWYIGTNPQTSGPNDPLPFELKSRWMVAIDPALKGHILGETSIFTMARAIYDKVGEGATIAYITDEADWAWAGPALIQYNGVKSKHGYFNFANIIHVPSPRISSATAVRQAAREGDKKAFYDAAGVSPSLKVGAASYYDTVVRAVAKYTDRKKKMNESREHPFVIIIPATKLEKLRAANLPVRTEPSINGRIKCFFNEHEAWLRAKELVGSMFAEDTEDIGFEIGDEVIVNGRVKYYGAKGKVIDFGHEKRFTIVDLYGTGHRAFQTVDLEPTEMNDEIDEAIPLSQLRQVAGADGSKDTVAQRLKNTPKPVSPLKPGEMTDLNKLKPNVDEAKWFRTQYGWAGGQKADGSMYKHPDRIAADRKARKEAALKKAAQQADFNQGHRGIGDEPVKEGEKKEKTNSGEYALDLAKRKAANHYKAFGLDDDQAFEKWVQRAIEHSENDDHVQFKRLDVLSDRLDRIEELLQQRALQEGADSFDYAKFDAIIKRLKVKAANSRARKEAGMPSSEIKQDPISKKYAVDFTPPEKLKETAGFDTHFKNIKNGDDKWISRLDTDSQTGAYNSLALYHTQQDQLTNTKPNTPEHSRILREQEMTAGELRKFWNIGEHQQGRKIPVPYKSIPDFAKTSLPRALNEMASADLDDELSRIYYRQQDINDEYQEAQAANSRALMSLLQKESEELSKLATLIKQYQTAERVCRDAETLQQKYFDPMPPHPLDEEVVTLKDCQGKTFKVGDSVARAKKMFAVDGVYAEIAKVTRIDGNRIYLNNSPQPLKFPDRVAVVDASRQGKPFTVGQKVCRAANMYATHVDISTITKVAGNKIYLNNSPQALKHPDRIVAL